MAPLHEIGIGDPGHLMPFWPINSTQRQWEATSSEANYDLRFPWSVDVYDRMSRTDGQVSAVFKAITLPILRANWDLNVDGVRDEVVAHVREDLALPEIGQSAPRNRISSVVWTDHLREALRALIYGFAVFEQTYEVDTTGDVPVVHLKKLAPRLASTVLRILVDSDGSLAAVVQKPPLWAWNITGNTAEAKWWGIVLPVANIVMYSHEREGADWYGRSILREAYKDFLLKDQFVRLNAQGIERNSMGVPVYHLADESRRSQAEQIVQDFRAGATAGLVIPAGDSIELLGVTGSVRDALPSIQYHDQAISKASLAMFLDLGHDRGAQNLGSTFISTFIKSLQSLADWIASTATEYIIRDLVVNAYGPDEAYPRLMSGDLAEQQVLAPADIALLVTAGAITKDASLDEWLRKSGGLPAPTEPADPAAGVPVDQRVNQPIPQDELPPTPQAIDVTTQEQAAYVGKLLGRVKDLTRRARSK